MSSSEEDSRSKAASAARKRRKRRYDIADAEEDEIPARTSRRNRSSASTSRKNDDSLVDQDDDGEDHDTAMDTTTPSFRTLDESMETTSDSPIPLQVDDDTLRIMVSTDNHLGYCERDPIRGMDSFAALEEVLYMAKHYQVDMVLLGGDLFHDNKPSRQTLHTTMDILRRYTMGPNAIQIQIISSPEATPFRVGQRDVVNYEDENYSVDLPIFSIHGNHDDPTREGGAQGELLSAMDFLDVSNLINYFGRQDQVNSVQISPILIQKGQTNLSLYGLGHMRDERLNRMWEAKNVRFLRPQERRAESEFGSSGQPDSALEWFNLFVIHQNRDYGRGTKNCINESMIPEWMDLVIYGHEHECLIEPQESVVGTFRVSQPGSSVAISLSAGEAVMKQVAILDIREGQFRMLPIPLTQVRTLQIADVSLSAKNDGNTLDPEDPNVDDKMTQMLSDQVQFMMHEAREEMTERLQLAQQKGNVVAASLLKQRSNNNNRGNDDSGDLKDDDFPLRHRMQQPEQSLIRLRVEHTGFTVLNNQRFGAKFVGQVANPTEILLFHRKRDTAGGSGGGRKKPAKADLGEAMNRRGEKAEELQIQDLVSEQLELADKKLELVNNSKINEALEEYVNKQQARALDELLNDVLGKRQETLIRKKREHSDSEEDEEVSMEQDEEGDEEDDPTPQKKKKTGKRRPTASSRGKGRRKKADDSDEEEESVDVDDDFEDREVAARGRGSAKVSGRKRAAQSAAAAKGSSRSRKAAASFDDDDEEVENDNYSSNRTSRTRNSPRRRGKGVPNYKEDDKDDDDSFRGDHDGSSSDEVQEVQPRRGRGKASAPKGSTTSRSKKTSNNHDVIELDDDDDEVEMSQNRGARGGNTKRSAKRTSTSTAGSRRSSAGSKNLSQSQLSFQPVSRGGRNKNSKTRGNNNDDSTSYDLDEDWGTATTNSFMS